MGDYEIEIPELDAAIVSTPTAKSEENDCSYAKKPFGGQEIIQNIAVVDIVFAVSHLCHFFFRLTKFTFNNLGAVIVYFYEFCWIALFAVYLLQFFMGSSLFMAAKDVVTPATFKHLLYTSTWWIRCSIFIIILHAIDGIILSVPINAEIKEENGDRYLYFKLHLVFNLSIETIASISEFLFRFCALLWVKKFRNQFYKLEILFPCND